MSYVSNITPRTNLNAIILLINKAFLKNLQARASGWVPLAKLTNHETDEQRQDQTDNAKTPDRSHQTPVSAVSQIVD